MGINYFKSKKCNVKSNTCLSTTQANCTNYEGGLNSRSPLDECNANIGETTQDIYKQLEDLYLELDTQELGESCIEMGNKKVKDVLKSLETEICRLKEEVENIKGVSPCNIKINTEDCPLDLRDIKDSCGESIVNLNQLLQHLINREPIECGEGPVPDPGVVDNQG